MAQFSLLAYTNLDRLDHEEFLWTTLRMCDDEELV